ncbi:MAG TPA: hypothetical protein VKA14_06015, partial [Gammaproteobacteria bacterium]|nr:hypothetical protein [Gammaproteobacteria bacterium]
ADLSQVFRDTVTAELGWRLVADRLTDLERSAVEAAGEEAENPWDEPGRPAVAGGIKLNHRTYLLERSADGGWVRLLLVNGRIARIALSAGVDGGPLVGQPPRADALEPMLAGALGQRDGLHWARLIEWAAEPVRSLEHD